MKQPNTPTTKYGTSLISGLSKGFDALAAKHKATQTEAKPKTGSKPDFLVQVALEVEMLPQKKAFAMVDELVEQRWRDDFKLGGVLSRILEKSKVDPAWLEGYPSFEDLVEERFKFGYRTAMYLIDIYRYLVENQIPGDIVKSLGWTKVSKMVETKVLTKKNAAEWTKKAKKLSVKKLEASLKGDGASEKPTAFKTPTAMLFKAGQKKGVPLVIEMAKEEENEEKPKVLLAKYDAATEEKHMQQLIDATNATTWNPGSVALGPHPDPDLPKPVKEYLLKDYWDERLDKDTQQLQADFPSGDDAPMKWLDAFQRAWPEIVVNVEFPE